MSEVVGKKNRPASDGARGHHSRWQNLFRVPFLQPPSTQSDATMESPTGVGTEKLEILHYNRRQNKDVRFIGVGAVCWARSQVRKRPALFPQNLLRKVPLTGRDAGTGKSNGDLSR